MSSAELSRKSSIPLKGPGLHGRRTKPAYFKPKRSVHSKSQIQALQYPVPELWGLNGHVFRAFLFQGRKHFLQLTMPIFQPFVVPGSGAMEG